MFEVRLVRKGQDRQPTACAATARCLLSLQVARDAALRVELVLQVGEEDIIATESYQQFEAM